MGERRASHAEQCPLSSFCWAPCARRSEPAPTDMSAAGDSSAGCPLRPFRAPRRVTAVPDVRNAGATLFIFREERMIVCRRASGRQTAHGDEKAEDP